MLPISLLLKLGLFPVLWLQVAVFQIMAINIMLAIFNLVPVYPLDGSKILTALLPQQTALEYEEIMRRYGTLVLILLIFPFNGVSPVARLLSPIINMVLSWLV